MTPGSDGAIPWFHPGVAALSDAISYTLAYADVFDYPLVAAEVHRYLVGISASLDEVEAALMEGLACGHRWEVWDGYYTWPGRGDLIEQRRRREHVASQLWPRAVRYGRLIARLPFVRMVALTGALTMGNVESGDDIDFLLVTEPGHLWLARLFTIGLVVKPGDLLGDEVCPNYLLTTDALVLPEHSLFTAHELAQMVPLYGLDVYRQMRQANAWANAFLPNAHGAPVVDDRINGRRYRVVHWLIEPWLRTPIGTWLERWERRRKIPALAAMINLETETTFDADQCKGHLGGHSSVAYMAFQQRLESLRR